MALIVAVVAALHTPDPSPRRVEDTPSHDGEGAPASRATFPGKGGTAGGSEQVGHGRVGTASWPHVIAHRPPAMRLCGPRL